MNSQPSAQRAPGVGLRRHEEIATTKNASSVIQIATCRRRPTSGALWADGCEFIRLNTEEHTPHHLIVIQPRCYRSGFCLVISFSQSSPHNSRFCFSLRKTPCE